MAEGVRLYVGTDHGLFVWRSSNGGWDEAGRLDPPGFARTIRGSQQHRERVFVGVYGDGVYRTEDAGAHWDKVFDGDVRSVAIDPSDDDVVYAGTEPVHLYRSEDRGARWEELRSLEELPEAVKRNWWF